MDLGTPKQRALVAALWPWRAAGRSRWTRIVDLLWERRRRRRAATATLQGYVSSLRQVLEPDRESAGHRRPCWSPSRRATPCGCPRTRSTPSASSRRPPPRPRPPPGSAGAGVGHRSDAGSARRRRLRSRRRRSARWRGTPYAELGDADRAPWPSGPGWRSCAWSRSRTGPMAGLGARPPPPRWPRTWRPSPMPTRCGSGCGALQALALTRSGAAGGRAGDPAPGARGAGRGARGWSRRPSCVPCRRRCSARTRTWSGWRRAESAGPAPVSAVPAADPPPHPPRRGGRARGRWSGGTASSQQLDGGAGGGRARTGAVRRPHRRARHRQVAARGRARRAGPDPRRRACWWASCSQDDGAPPLWPWGTVLAGPRRRRGPRAEADGGPASSVHGRADRPEPCATRPCEAPVVVVLEDLHWADSARRCGCSGLIAETTEAGPAPGARHLARAPGAHRGAGRRRRDAGPSARRPCSRLDGLPTGVGRGTVVEGVTSATAVDERSPSTCCAPHGGQPVLPGGVRPARAGARPSLDALLDEEGPPTGVGRGAHPPAGPPARGDPGPAADRRRRRPGLRHPDPGGGHRGRRGRRARPGRAGPGRRAGATRRASTSSGSPTPWSATPCARRCPPPAAPGRTPGSPRCWPTAVGRETEVRDPLAGRGTVVRRRAWRAAVDAGAHRPGAATPTTRRPRCSPNALASLAADPEATPYAPVRRPDAARRRLPLGGAAPAAGRDRGAGRGRGP